MELNFKLHPAQLNIFNSPKRFRCVAAGRRFGKSYLSAVELLIEGLRTENDKGYDIRNKEVWYIAPTFQQAKDIMWNLLKALGEDVIASTLENTCTARLINGRTIQLKGSDRPDTLRGVGMSFVVLDEYAFMKPDVWETIIRPTLADVKGKALFIGTPAGKNHFYELWKAGAEGLDLEWESFQFNSKDNVTLDPEEIEAAKGQMSASSFRQEFEASFEASGAGIFKEDMIQIVQSAPVWTAEGFWYVAVDPAGYTDVQQATTSALKRLDEHAIAIVNVSPEGWYVKDIRTGRWGVREASLQIVKAARDVRASGIGIEKGSLKNAVMPYLDDQMKRLNTWFVVEPLTHGGKKKTERISWALQGRFEHNRIFIQEGSWNKKFIEQLLDFPNPMAHDDMLDALAYIDQLANTAYAGHVETPQFVPLDDITGI